MVKKKSPYPSVVETYQLPWGIERVLEKPGVFNGDVYITRYKITVEVIEEPEEVILQRLRDLHEAESNYHSRSALRDYAWKRFKVRL